MTRKQRRLALVLSLLCGLSLAAFLMSRAFNDALVFFYSPSDVQTRHIAPGQVFRLGGMVEKGSVIKTPNTAKVSFIVTDFAQKMLVTYDGILPDLFREGQGVVAQGSLSPDGKQFVATQVLAKHDENYMPPEVARSLKTTPDGQHTMPSLHERERP